MTIKVPFVLVIGLTVLACVVHSQEKREHHAECSINDQAELEIEVFVYKNDDKDDLTSAYPLGDGVNDYKGCAGEHEALVNCAFQDMGDHYYLKIVMSIPSDPEGVAQMLSSSANANDCGVRYKNKKYSFQIVSRSEPDLDIWTKGELCSDVICDLDKLTSNELELNGDNTAISNDFPSISLPKIPKYRIEMFVKKENHAVMNTAKPGDLAYLQIDYYPPNSQSEYTACGKTFHFGFIKAGSDDPEENVYQGDRKIHFLFSTFSSLAKTPIIGTKGINIRIQSNLLEPQPNWQPNRNYVWTSLKDRSSRNYIPKLKDNIQIYNGYFKVTASEEICIHAVQRVAGSTGALSVIPDDLLGTKKYCMFYKNRYDRMTFVGTRDNTDVSFKMPKGGNNMAEVDNVSYDDEETAVFTLDENEVKHISTINRDITGCIISSNKPISVTLGYNKLNVPGGNVRYDHSVSQLPSADTLGRSKAVLATQTSYPRDVNQYIVVPYQSGTSRNVIRMVSAENGVTATWHTNVGVVTSHTFTDEALTFEEFQIAANTPIGLEIYANGPIQVGLFTPSATSVVSEYDHTFQIVPVTSQWGSIQSFVIMKDHANVFTLVIAIRRTAKGTLKLDGNAFACDWKDVWDKTNTAPGTSEFVFCQHELVGISEGHHILRPDDTADTFYGVLYSHSASNNPETFAENYQLAGMRQSPLPQTLDQLNKYKEDMSEGDGLDNDGDGLIDEEAPNGLDDDGDGLIDEDLQTSIEGLGPRAIRPYYCWVSPFDVFDESRLPNRRIVNTDGCRNGEYLGRGFFLEGGNFARKTDPDASPGITRTGLFPIASFENYNVIYYRCHIHYCLTYDEPMCDQLMCPSGIQGTTLKRKKREAINVTGTLDNEPFEAVAAVIIIQDNQGLQQQSVPGPSETESSAIMESCVGISTFIIVAVVLVVLVIFSVVAVVYLVKRLRG